MAEVYLEPVFLGFFPWFCFLFLCHASVQSTVYL